MDQHQLCFETLANDLRMEILKSLHDGERSVTELAEELGVERSRLSHALQILKNCNYVLAEKRGRENYYSLNSASPLLKTQKGNLFTIIESHACTQCNTCHKHGDSPQFGNTGE